MPRRKRTLAEADPNINPEAPTGTRRKTATTATAKSKAVEEPAQNSVLKFTGQLLAEAEAEAAAAAASADTSFGSRTRSTTAASKEKSAPASEKAKTAKGKGKARKAKDVVEPLAETDPGATADASNMVASKEKSAPASGKAKSARGRGKNDASKTKDVVEPLVEAGPEATANVSNTIASKEKSAPASGKAKSAKGKGKASKAKDVVEPSTEADSNATADASNTTASKDKSVTEAANATKTKRKPVAKKVTEVTTKWMIFCRPGWDRGSDSEPEDEDEESDPYAVVPDATDRALGDELDRDGHCKDCKCGEPLEKSPNWPWRVTELGWDLLQKWQEEMMNRDQDVQGVYIYNDFTGYGIQEVMENQFVAFNKAFIKPGTSAVELWGHIEGMALFMNMDLHYWYMSDDPQSMAETVELYGVALLTVLGALKTKRLLKPGSPISNIPLIVSLWFVFAQTWDQFDQGFGETGWTKVAFKLLKEADIEFEPCARKAKEMLEDIEADIEEDELEEDDSDADGAAASTRRKKSGTKIPKVNRSWMREDDQDEDGTRMWKEWDWKIEFRDFCQSHSQVVIFPGAGRHWTVIGGTHYDITKMSKAEKKQYTLGG